MVLDALRRGWLVGLVALGTTATATVILTKRQPTVYESAANVLVSPSPEIVEPMEFLRALESLERRSILATFAEVAKSPAVRRSAAARLEWDDAELRRYRVSASVLPRANVLRVVVEGPAAGQTAALAHAVAAVLEAEADRSFRPYAVSVLSEPATPRVPVLPDFRRNYIVGGILGLFLAAGLAFSFGRLVPLARQALDPTLARVHAAD